MRWSKLRTLVKERWAPPFDTRLDIHSAAYGDCSCGHAWLTWDGDVIANFCTRAHSIASGWEHGSNKPNRMYDHQLAAFGEMSRQEVYRALWSFVHSLPIEEALRSDDLLIQALAVVDTRVGKRRLLKVDPEALHPLGRHFWSLRTGIIAPDASIAHSPIGGMAKGPQIFPLM